MELSFDAVPDGSAELEALLEDSGVDFRREGDRFRFLFSSRGCKWQTVCDCRPGLVLVYGVHPARVICRQAALEVCAQLNREVVRGGFFLQEERFVFRTGAGLTEFWSARESIAQALEYNAGILSFFWERLTAGAEGSGFSY